MKRMLKNKSCMSCTGVYDVKSGDIEVWFYLEDGKVGFMTKNLREYVQSFEKDTDIERIKRGENVEVKNDGFYADVTRDNLGDTVASVDEGSQVGNVAQSPVDENKTGEIKEKGEKENVDNEEFKNLG